MTVLLGGETLVLILLSLLVAGLLRSHAEILRQLSAFDERLDETSVGGEGVAKGVPVARDSADPSHASDIIGTTLDGEAIKVSVGAQNTLLAFLSSGCLTCHGFWEAFQPADRPAMPRDVRLVVVTKDTTHESPSRLRELAPPDIPVIMSTAGWEAYQVPTAPYFIYVDAESGEVRGEGAASAWNQVLSLLRDALEDDDLTTTRASSRTDSQGARELRVEGDLARAGVTAGDPTLYSP